MLMMHRSIVILLLLVFVLGTAPAVYGTSSDESQLKAVFVLNFARLTEWPPDAGTDGSKFTIAIIGKAPPAAFISMLRGQMVRGAGITVRLVENVRQAKDCQLLYVSSSERHSVPGIVRDIGQSPILTVSDMAGFCEAGGMIGLVPVQNKLGFEVNVTAVRKARLNVSSQLLKLARNIFNK
jgi:hypothetical protein